MCEVFESIKEKLLDKHTNDKKQQCNKAVAAEHLVFSSKGEAHTWQKMEEMLFCSSTIMIADASLMWWNLCMQIAS